MNCSGQTGKGFLLISHTRKGVFLLPAADPLLVRFHRTIRLLFFWKYISPSISTPFLYFAFSLPEKKPVKALRRLVRFPIAFAKME
jgi:hypothetical protein